MIQRDKTPAPFGHLPPVGRIIKVRAQRPKNLLRGGGAHSSCLPVPNQIIRSRRRRRQNRQSHRHGLRSHITERFITGKHTEYVRIRQFGLHRLQPSGDPDRCHFPLFHERFYCRCLFIFSIVTDPHKTKRRPFLAAKTSYLEKKQSVLLPAYSTASHDFGHRPPHLLGDRVIWVVAIQPQPDTRMPASAPHSPPSKILSLRYGNSQKNIGSLCQDPLYQQKKPGAKGRHRVRCINYKG